VNERDRFHKPDPKRSQPKRNVGEALRNEDPWSVRPQPGKFRDSDVGDESVSDGVDEAYRVADDQMREGQWRARWRAQRGYDWRGYGSPFGAGFSGRPSDGVLEQITRVYLDMMGVVGSLVNGLVRPPYSRAPFDNRREPEYGPPPPRMRSASVRVEVSSSQSNHVAVDLQPLEESVELSVPPLRAQNNGKPELRDVQFETENGRCVLRIKISDTQPPGLYSAAVVESRTGEHYGTVAVQVGNKAASSGKRRK